MFYRYEIYIRYFVFLVHLFPVFILKYFYSFSKPFQGLFAILIRYSVLTKLCKSCGKNVFIGSHVELRYLNRMSIGNNVSIQNGCYIDARGGIEIQNDVSIAHRSSFVSFDHGHSDPAIPIRKNKLIKDAITVESDVWIGAGTILLAGTKIPSRCIIAAGSVVTKKSKPVYNSIYGGVPVRKLKDI